MLKTSWEQRDKWAAQIRTLRKEKRMRQVEVARAANVSLSSIQKIEAGTEGSMEMFESVLAVLISNGKKRR